VAVADPRSRIAAARSVLASSTDLDCTTAGDRPRIYFFGAPSPCAPVVFHLRRELINVGFARSTWKTVDVEREPSRKSGPALPSLRPARRAWRSQDGPGKGAVRAP
jgi:hypothetical protein